MAVSPAAATAGGEEAALRDLLREALPRAGVAADALLEVERSVLPSTTSYTTAALTARLRGGGTVRTFLKDFGHSRLPKDGAAARRRREIHVYRDLLDGSEAGTPEYYGSLQDEAAGRFWLLLELVDGVQLRECELDAWIAAARWLARLHVCFAERAAELQRSPLLIRHDEEYFRSKAVEAQRAMRSFRDQARRRTAALLDGYEELAAAMGREPRTLVHGNYRAKNVVVQRSPRRTRVVPVDWEVAAVGSPLYDLGHLLDGFRGDALRALLEAYRAEAQALGMPAPGDAETMRLMRAFCLHRVVKSLARAVEKGFGERDVSDLLDHGERLREEIAR